MEISPALVFLIPRQGTIAGQWSSRHERVAVATIVAEARWRQRKHPRSWGALRRQRRNSRKFSKACICQTPTLRRHGGATPMRLMEAFRTTTLFSRAETFRRACLDASAPQRSWLEIQRESAHAKTNRFWRRSLTPKIIAPRSVTQWRT